MILGIMKHLIKLVCDKISTRLNDDDLLLFFYQRIDQVNYEFDCVVTKKKEVYWSLYIYTGVSISIFWFIFVRVWIHLANWLDLQATTELKQYHQIEYKNRRNKLFWDGKNRLFFLFFLMKRLPPLRQRK